MVAVHKPNSHELEWRVFSVSTQGYFAGSAPALRNFGRVRLGLPADFQFQLPGLHTVWVLTRRVVNGDPTDATTRVSTCPHR